MDKKEEEWGGVVRLYICIVRRSTKDQFLLFFFSENFSKIENSTMPFTVRHLFLCVKVGSKGAAAPFIHPVLKHLVKLTIFQK